MAKHFLRADSVPVIIPEHFSQAAAIMARFDRAAIGNAIEVLVGLLDVLDDDPDVEPNGDETDHDRAEDCFSIGPKDHANGAGCPIADPGGCQHDGREPDDGDLCGHYGVDQTTGPTSPYAFRR